MEVTQTMSDDKEPYLLRNTVEDRIVYIIVFPLIIIFPVSMWYGLFWWEPTGLFDKVVKHVLLDVATVFILFLVLLLVHSFYRFNKINTFMQLLAKKSLIGVITLVIIGTLAYLLVIGIIA